MEAATGWGVFDFLRLFEARVNRNNRGEAQCGVWLIRPGMQGVCCVMPLLKGICSEVVSEEGGGCPCSRGLTQLKVKVGVAWGCRQKGRKEGEGLSPKCP